jgi:hypothetical protein
MSVTDGTYNWDETTGNPGSPATATATIVSGFVVGATVTSGGSGYTSAPSVAITGNGSGAAATATVSNGAVTAINITNAGSGYTTGATITIAPPPAPFTVNYSGGTITATYATAPAAGTAITATYRYSASGIAGALAAGAEQWLELTVDGVAQSPRQKVLAVPFAMMSQRAETAASLERKVKTCQLNLFSAYSTENITGYPNSSWGVTVRKLPTSVSPNDRGNGTGDSFYKTIGYETNVIYSISADVTITGTAQYPPTATIELAAYSKIGARIVVASNTRTTRP